MSLAPESPEKGLIEMYHMFPEYQRRRYVLPIAIFDGSGVHILLCNYRQLQKNVASSCRKQTPATLDANYTT